MRKRKRRALAAGMGALLFALGLFTGALVAPAEDPRQAASRMEAPVVSAIDLPEALLLLAPGQVTAAPMPEYAAEDYLYAMTTDRAVYIPAEYMPARVARYSSIEMSSYELWELACIIWLEARGECPEGQQAVAEVILNRVLRSGFPNTIHDVIHDDGGIGVVQFTTAVHIDEAEPDEAQFEAIFAALYGDTILPAEVVFFSREGENDRAWGTIGNHVFCYEYDWGN